MALPIPASILNTNLTGSIVSGAFGLYAQSKANKANRKEAQKSREFQREMSNTSYQRMVNDLKLAGLNPMLAYTKGGASTPPGGTGAPQQSIAKGAVESATGVRKLSEEVKTMRAQRLATNAQATKLNSDVLVNVATERRLAQDTATSAQNAEYIRQNTKRLELEMPGLEIDAAINRSSEGQVIRRIKMYGSALSGFVGGMAGGSIMGLGKRNASRIRKNKKSGATYKGTNYERSFLK